MRIVSLLLLSGLVAAAVPAAAQDALVPTPRATPVSISPTNRPFLAADHAVQPANLAAAGFIEEEYLVSGLAGTYAWGATAQDPVKVQVQGVPWTTRLLLRRPKDAKKFSGRVVVEVLDAGSGHDTAPLWGASHARFMAGGDAWVGLTVAPGAVAALQRFDPVRYAALAVPAGQADSCQPVASAEEGGLAWDIIAQTAALLRSSSKENPLLQFQANEVIASAGGSAGDALITYSNALHDLVRLGGGAPMYDGYLAVVDGAGSAPINPCAPALAETDPRRGVMPRDVPFVAVMAEAQPGIQPDASDTDYRLYQIAGAAGPLLQDTGRPAVADLAIAGVAADSCADAQSASVWSLALNAIWQQLQERLAAGTPMNGAPGAWRLPPVELPLADQPQSSCSSGALAQRYDAVKLKQLYGSRGEYLRRFQSAVDAAVQERRLTIEDGAALKSSTAKAVPAF